MTDLVGRQLGSYTLESELGSGGMGSVYLATAASGKRAIKVLHPHLLDAKGAFERFQREAELGLRVEHPNVVRTFDVGSAELSDGTHHYLVMEYVEGQTLRGLLEELGRVPEELCRHIAHEIASGLGAIHAAGAIHRDLKPENVLITAGQVVKIMDLGIAYLHDAAFKLSQTGAFLGSVQYAAPEQFHGVALDPRADYYSLGLVLYELATGARPFRAETFADVLRRQLNEVPAPAGEVNPQLSPFFEEVCKSLLEKDRDERLGSWPVDEESDWWKERVHALRVATKRPLRRIRIPRETDLYGRDAELARLGAAYAQVQAGEGRVLLVEGEAGIGKTRLIDELVRSLEADGEELNFLFGSYSPGGTASAFTGAYGEHFGLDSLEDTLPGHLSATPNLVPAFSALLRGEPTPQGGEPLDANSILTCFVHATQSMAGQRPTVVLIDDLHFAPEAGRALFTALAMAVPGHRVLLIGTMRPGVPTDWVAQTTRLEHCEQLSLGRLGNNDLAQLLTESLRSPRLANELGKRIESKSDGNPLFALEIVRELQEGRYLTQSSDGTWVTTREIEQIQIPSSVMDFIQARIAELDEEERDLLEVAACCGFEFDPGLVAEAAGTGRIPTLKRLGRIEREHRLIRSAGRAYRFDHHQVQEALYAGLHEMMRESYHAAIADALEKRAGSDGPDGALAESLCDHHFKGAQPERALRYLTSALDHLAGIYRNEAVIELADRALDEPGLLEGGERVEILLRKATRLDLIGRQDAARGVLEEALALADEVGDAASRGKVRHQLGDHLRRTKDVDVAIEWLHEALELALESGVKELEGNVHGTLGNAFSRLNKLDEAREHYERCLALAEEADHARGEGAPTVNLGNIAVGLGRLEEGRQRFERALEITKRVDNPSVELHAVLGMANVHFSAGRPGDALPYLERCLALARKMGDRREEATALGNLGLLLQSFGRTEEAREHYERCVTLAREVGQPRMECFAKDGLADLLDWEGEHEEARREYRECIELQREQQEFGRMVVSLVALGWLEAALGNHGQASACWDEALAALGDNDDGDAVVPLAIARAAAGQEDAGVEAALAVFAEHEERLAADTTLDARFRLWKLTSDRQHLEAAHGILAEMRDSAPEEHREGLIRNIPLHRAIMEAWEAADE